MRIHHIGIAVENIEKIILYIDNFSKVKNVSEIIFDKNQNARLVLLTMLDGSVLELIEGDIVKTYLKKKMNIYHMCYEIDTTIEEAIKEMVDKGALLISEPKEAILFNNRKVAFLMTDIGLIEILE